MPPARRPDPQNDEHLGHDPDLTADDLGADQAQDAMDVETDQGYRGVSPDPTPNHHYTVQGVTKGLPTPETHPEQAAKVAEHRRTLRI